MTRLVSLPFRLMLAGLGMALLQVQSDGSLKIVNTASRALSDTEKRYAIIEQEALGGVWGCEKFSDYILGITVTIQIDHKPLVPLLHAIELRKLQAQTQRFRMRLMSYSYMIEHIAGKKICRCSFSLPLSLSV